MTRLSVFMPVLNEEDSVASTISSVLAQGSGDLELEVVVADGCSADGTAEVVEELAARDSRIRLVSNPDVSIPAALNRCLAAATGEYVARVDGHSAVSTGYFAAALRWLETEPGLAGVGGHRTGTASTAVGRAICLVLSSRVGVGNSIYHYSQVRQETDHATFGVYRASAVREIDGWDEDLPVNEDVDFDHRLRERGHRLGYEPAMVVRWQVRETLPDLFGQFRRYGRGKAAMVRKNGRSALRLRHLAPPVAVAGTAAVLVAGTLLEPWLLLALAPYTGLITAASVQAWRGRDLELTTAWWALPPAFVIMHAAWGLGFLEGLLLRRAPARASGRAEVRDESPDELRAPVG